VFLKPAPETPWGFFGAKNNKTTQHDK
jgi:hypothetical protein